MIEIKSQSSHQSGLQSSFTHPNTQNNSSAGLQPSEIMLIKRAELNELFSQILCTTLPENLHCYPKFNFKTNGGDEVVLNGNIIPFGKIKPIETLQEYDEQFPGLRDSNYNFHSNNSKESLFYRGIVRKSQDVNLRHVDDEYYKIFKNFENKSPEKKFIVFYAGKRSVLENNLEYKDDFGNIVPFNPPNYYNDINVARSMGRILEAFEMFSKINSLMSLTLCNSIPKNAVHLFPEGSMPVGNIKQINSLKEFDKYFPRLKEKYDFSSDTKDSLFDCVVILQNPESGKKSFMDIYLLVHKISKYTLAIGTLSVAQNDSKETDDFGDPVSVNPSTSLHDAILIKSVGRKLEDIEMQAETNSLYSKFKCHSIPQNLRCYKNLETETNLESDPNALYFPANQCLIPIGGCVNEITTVAKFDQLFPRFRDLKYNAHSNPARFSNGQKPAFYWAIDHKDKVNFRMSKDDILYKVDEETGLVLLVGPRSTWESYGRTIDDFGEMIPHKNDLPDYYLDVETLIALGKGLEKLEKHRLEHQPTSMADIEELQFNLELIQEKTPSNPYLGKGLF